MPGTSGNRITVSHFRSDPFASSEVQMHCFELAFALALAGKNAHPPPQKLQKAACRFFSGPRCVALARQEGGACEHQPGNRSLHSDRPDTVS